jgi:histidine triad (HIT) family protein
MAKKVSNAVKQVLNCEGINLIQSSGEAAGQDVFHFHLHIKPRWKNDDVTLEWDKDPKEKDERIKTARMIADALV